MRVSFEIPSTFVLYVARIWLWTGKVKESRLDQLLDVDQTEGHYFYPFPLRKKQLTESNSIQYGKENI